MTRIGLSGVIALLALRAAVAHADDGTRPLVCVDDSDVVGYRHCEQYGEWGQALRGPHVFVEVGGTYRYFATTPAEPVSTTSRSSMPSSSSSSGTVKKTGPSSHAMTYDERVGASMSNGLYAAVEIELGNFAWDGGNDPDSIVAGLGSIGLQHKIGPFTLAGEVAGGIMASTYSDERIRDQGVAEARGRVDIWVSPWATLGVVGGRSMIDHGDWMAGVNFALHTHAYGR